MTAPGRRTTHRAPVHRPVGGAGGRGGGRRWWKGAIFLVLIVALFVLAVSFDLDDRLERVRLWIDDLGPWAPLAFIGIYVAATVVMIPGGALTAVAGRLFGPVLGVVYVNIAATLGATICFLVARYVAREHLAEWLDSKPLFRRVDQLTEDRGGLIVALTRLVPILPYNLLNYGFGLTRVGFWPYLLWTWLCTIPNTMLYVIGGDAVLKGIREGRVPWRLLALVVACAALLAALAWIFGRRLRPATPGAAAAPEALSPEARP